jgi:hypothetical protein
MDDMLDLTVLRSGLVDEVCVVLFEVGVISASERSAPLRLLLEGHEGL